MKIGIIEASGNIGSRTHAEARGHDVPAFTRSGAAAKGAPWRDLDVFDFDALRAVVASVDVVVSAHHPGNAARDIGDALQRAIADPTAYARVAKNLVKALERRTATRAIVVGGAANLEIAPGVTTDEDDERLRQVFRSIGVPEAYAEQPMAIAMRSTSCACRTALDLREPLCGSLRRGAHRPLPHRRRPAPHRRRRPEPHVLRRLRVRHPRRN